jgi:uncharacterized membrane protein
MVKAVKYFIALAPVVGLTASRVTPLIQAGQGANALNIGAATLVASYTGYDYTGNTWRLGNLAVGVVPMGAAWVFGKLASRVLR